MYITRTGSHESRTLTPSFLYSLFKEEQASEIPGACCSDIAMSQKLMLNTIVSNATATAHHDIRVGTPRRDFTGNVLSEADKPVAVNLYGRVFEPEEQWIKKVNGTKPGGRLEVHFVRSCGWSCARGTLMGIALASGTLMMASETCCEHGAWQIGIGSECAGRLCVWDIE